MQMTGQISAVPSQRQHADAAVTRSVHVVWYIARSSSVAVREGRERPRLQLGVKTDVRQDVFAYFWRVCRKA